MKKKFIPLLLVGTLATSLLVSCNRDDNASAQEQSITTEALVRPDSSELLCSYVDGNWTFSSVLKTGLPTTADTSFMNTQMQKNASLWGLSVPTLRFVDDPSNPSSTYNAISYGSGKIYYGYAIYKDAKTKSSDNIVNAMILAHEYGHQLQFKNSLPSVKEPTARSLELEADGFAGYYLRKPAGFNKSNFSQIAAAYEFAASIGDNYVNDPGHHGTAPQRRTAVRLGFLLGQYSLTVKSFDSNFFYYYSSVLNGQDPTVQPAASNFKVDPEIDRTIRAHMTELKQIMSGQISAEEFKNLN
ncbi:metalloprotease [Elizabethkingia meningoseptica]|uniref:metalloprotease n=1 Tax=Elizabethkingia meningoseptica TaxID=238 RepID=UPI0023B111D4|nr:metalloprotease [Elizabethkingia meningoseptica]MDE5468385.1 metalloprotease [Elizabethkingia meningoseptica]MDE5475562.1 metalloprotease [Elizabethkingia meningoseptica]MDE5479438.1 metalloprotease [Elizabethkingia meningoseptica]MDE5485585.1 metalloprotease [Elizabethkingia meningoseptica]MDE5502840.1 metalloprotease [Elizabethkingia meningoseptica]